MPIASRMICPATTATTRMIVAYTVARSAVRRRSARVRDAVNPAKMATLPIGSMVVQIVAKSLLILMSKGDMVNGERLTPEVERERGKVATWGEADGVASRHFNIRTAEKSAKVTSSREIAPRYEDREQDRSRAHSGRV